MFANRWKSLLLSAVGALACVMVFSATMVPARAADQELIDAAKAEGEVVWYTTLIVNQLVRPMVEAFEEKYGITVRYARANSTETALKILNEARAGQVQVDVFDGTSTVEPLKKEGIVLKWQPDSAADLPEEFIDQEGYWVATNLYMLTPAFNTAMVEPGSEPKTWDDLLDPKWKGNIAWTGTSSTSGGPGFVGLVLEVMGEEKGMEFLRKMAEQDVVNLSVSARQVLDRVIAGEYPIALQIFNHHTIISGKKGAPIQWIPMQPAVLGNLSTTGIAKDAPHPNAAKLLFDFLISEEGQKVFQQAGYLPMLPGVPALTPELKPEQGGFKAVFFTPEEIGEKLPQWTEVFGELFR
ncbi:MAG TPA: extracellular solute-binding protein [Afifellaceae bacterium]|nr:extracellular solute-binding protein [Afifellaceae bacterium]